VPNFKSTAIALCLGVASAAVLYFVLYALTRH